MKDLTVHIKNLEMYPIGCRMNSQIEKLKSLWKNYTYKEYLICKNKQR